jgi:hypothetical protein
MAWSCFPYIGYPLTSIIGAAIKAGMKAQWISLNNAKSFLDWGWVSAEEIQVPRAAWAGW